MNVTQQPSSATVTAVKGHFITKSSTLSTGNCKLEKQFITAQHLASHYKRVINAKSSIDTTPPKSMLKSQIARDRAKREMLNISIAKNSMNRAKSADSNLISQSITDTQTDTKTSRTIKSARADDLKSRSSKKDEEFKPKPLPDQEKLNKSMSNLMTSFTMHSKNRTMLYNPNKANDAVRITNSEQNVFNTNSRSARTEDRTRNALTTLMFNSQNSKDQDLKQTQTIHPALKAMSRLVSGRNYDVLDNHAEKFKMPEKEFVPRIKNTSSSSNLVRNSSCYQPPRRRKNRSAQSTQRDDPNVVKKSNRIETNTIKSPLKKQPAQVSDSDEDSDVSDNFLNQPRNIVKPESKLNLKESNEFLNSSKINQEMLRKEEAEKEEELKYLGFVKEVTDDIIARGISSNRVINNCFEHHIKKNKPFLNEAKMRDLLKTLRKDIGVPEKNENENIDDPAYHNTINQAVKLDRRNSTADSNGDRNEYLVVKTIRNDESKHHQTQIDASVDHNETKLKSKSSSRRSSTNSIENSNNLIDAYENQIVKNIESIRHSSGSSNNDKENSNPKNRPNGLKKDSNSSGSRKNSNESNELYQSPKPSILKKTSNSSSPERAVRHSNTSLRGNTSLKNETQMIHKDNYDDDDDDDDDDIFSGSFHPDRTANLNDSKSKSHKNLEYSEDALFNDNYGESVDEEGEDDFDQMLRTKTFNKYKNAGKQNFDEAEHRANTPQPAPRKQAAKKVKELSSDDEY